MKFFKHFKPSFVVIAYWCTHVNNICFNERRMLHCVGTWYNLWYQEQFYHFSIIAPLQWFTLIERHSLAGTCYTVDTKIQRFRALWNKTNKTNLVWLLFKKNKRILERTVWCLFFSVLICICHFCTSNDSYSPHTQKKTSFRRPTKTQAKHTHDHSQCPNWRHSLKLLHLMDFTAWVLFLLHFCG